MHVNFEKLPQMVLMIILVKERKHFPPCNYVFATLPTRLPTPLKGACHIYLAFCYA